MAITYSDPDVDSDADTVAIAGLTGTGLIARTGTGTAAVRTITAGSGVTVTDGDGVSGNPTVSLDADLTAIAGLTPTDGGFIVGDGAAFVVESGATARTSLGLTIGVDVQAYDADLASWAGVNPSSYSTTAQIAAAYQPLDADLTAAAAYSYAASAGPLVAPGGRLTLTTGVPVTTSDVTTATTIYYAPYSGNRIPIYDGTNWASRVFTELSNATAQSSTGNAGPAAVANDTNYDLFVWDSSGTLYLTRGTAWTDGTTRANGLTLTNGVYLNTDTITNGPAALRGTYVGTVRSNGSAQIMDSVLRRLCWNMYNRRPRATRVIEGVDSWNYTTATIRQANGSAANQFDYVCGLAEDSIAAEVNIDVYNDNAGGVLFVAGIGVDSTTAFSGLHPMRQNVAANRRTGAGGSYRGVPGIGYHYVAWLEYSGAGVGTTTWGGDNGNSALYQSGMTGEVWA